MSDATKFTPGPWLVEAPEHNLGARVIKNANGYCIGEAWDANANPENVANARLIAAAPDLYAIAKRPMVVVIEESESTIRLFIDKIEIAAVDFESAAAGALLQFNADQQAALAKATTP